MFSISVSNLPEDVTEDQIILHFNKLAEVREAVVAVSIAYDNAEEIRECKKRGDLIRAKVNLVHVSYPSLYLL
jgi:RNA recognition motif-containing protein